MQSAVEMHMGRKQHSLTSLGLGPMAWLLVGQPHLLIPTAVLGWTAYHGANAPDWMEITQKPERVPDWNGGMRWQRRSIIPHRTLTHWWPIWALAIAIGWHYWGATVLGWRADSAAWYGAWMPGLSLRSIAICAWAGFCTGAVGHLLCDLPNPSGIPLFLPNLPVTLKAWRSDDAPANWSYAATVAISGLACLVTIASGIGLGYATPPFLAGIG